MSTFPNISHLAFAHELDVDRLKKVKAIPGVAAILRKYTEKVLKETEYQSLKHNAVEIGPKQFPTINDIICNACDTLSVQKPKVYINSDREFNAYAMGVSTHVIVVNSGLVDAFSDDELAFVIAHEVGHIKCNHMLYKTAADLMTLAGAEAAGAGAQATAAAGLAFALPVSIASAVAISLIRSSLAKWSRAAEFTCDRAGLLVVKDPEVSGRALAKLSGFSSRLNDELSVDSFLDQYAFTDVKDYLDRASKYEFMATHPDTVIRAKALFEWHKSSHYQQIIRGDFLTVDQESKEPEIVVEGKINCAKCGKTNEKDWDFCLHCGEKLEFKQSSAGLVTESAVHSCGKCGQPVQAEWDFCKSCGTKL